MKKDPDVTQIAQPSLTYIQAMRSLFVWQGVTYAVAICPLDILNAFLSFHCTSLLTEHPHVCGEVFSCLKYGDVGRWQALDTAMTYGVPLPLKHTC